MRPWNEVCEAMASSEEYIISVMFEAKKLMAESSSEEWVMLLVSEAKEVINTCANS